jgi:hypothetical protein
VVVGTPVARDARARRVVFAGGDVALFFPIVELAGEPVIVVGGIGRRRADRAPAVTLSLVLALALRPDYGDLLDGDVDAPGDPQVFDPGGSQEGDRARRWKLTAARGGIVTGRAAEI